MGQMAFGFVAEEAKRQEDTRKTEYELRHRHSWRVCWNWDGPTAGGACDIHTCCVTLAEPVEGNTLRTIYAYIERCILLEERPDGTWLAEIAMGIVHGKPWHKDGTRVLLKTTDIWPPTRDLMKQRRLNLTTQEKGDCHAV